MKRQGKGPQRRRRRYSLGVATMERIGKVVVNAIVHRTFTAMKGVDDQALPTHSQLKSKGLVKGPSSDGGVYSKSHGKRRSEGGWPTNKLSLIHI